MMHASNYCMYHFLSSLNAHPHFLGISVSHLRLVSEATYGKSVLTTENGGFNTFASVFHPGNGRIGPAFRQFRSSGAPEIVVFWCSDWPKLVTFLRSHCM